MAKHKAKHPESLMMSYGYKPELSEGAIKCPIFQTSTFVFESAEEGKAFFEVAYGLREPREGEEAGLIYSRINNPDLEVLEDRLALWDKAEDCAVFESGMSAISTCLMEMLQPGDLLLYSNPVYGGTDHFIKHTLTKFGIEIMGFSPDQSPSDVQKQVEDSGMADKLAMVYIETPANPTNALIDIEGFAKMAKSYNSDDREVMVAVDNTYLGPLYQHPLSLGADLVLYSATKYIGGHSDLIAGACLGSEKLMKRVKELRSFLGSMTGPYTGWLLMRSLETLKIRMDQQVKNARYLADFLRDHPRVEYVYYLGHLDENDGRAYEIYKNQCLAPGAMLSFDIKGGEKAAFRFLNSLTLISLAVSLGSTESLAEHPASMTHAGVDPEVRAHYKITDKLIRISVGVEHHEDLIADVAQSLEQV